MRTSFETVSKTLAMLIAFTIDLMAVLEGLRNLSAECLTKRSRVAVDWRALKPCLVGERGKYVEKFSSMSCVLDECTDKKW